MNNLVVIESGDLPELKQLYDVQKPLHATTTVLIDHFIKRFNKKPEWTKIVKFFSLNYDWKTTGSFVMINDRDDQIMFNTLEPAPFPSLHKIFELLHFDKPFELFADEIFETLLFDVIRKHDLEIVFNRKMKATLNEIDNEIDKQIHVE